MFGATAGKENLKEARPFGTDPIHVSRASPDHLSPNRRTNSMRIARAEDKPTTLPGLEYKGLQVIKSLAATCYRALPCLGRLALPGGVILPETAVVPALLLPWVVS